MTRISVVIASKDRARYIERAIESFERQAGAPSFEVVVVDNASTDDTKAVVERMAARVPFALRYTFEPEPNRGKARNRGIALAQGSLIVFCDDDVFAPPGFLAAHDAAHHASGNLVVNGPILNVPSYEERPRPTAANFSRAFLCTCNVSIPKHALDAVGGFDEQFTLYGWEDTELGVRLREAGLRWRFAWDPYIWHIKTEQSASLDIEVQKALEKAKMARRFIAKSDTPRARLATGAHPLNVLRGRYLLPEWLLAVYAGAASDARMPAPLRAFARGQLLDGVYTRELVRELDGERR